MTFRLLLALTFAFAAAATAYAADTVLLSDDAEGTIDAKWVVGTPDNPAIQPWQKSDSTTLKYPPGMAHGGATSYWSGVSPQDNHPTDVIQGSSTLTTKAPILIPADGKTTVSLWSFFQNEGDDQGLVEAAVDMGGKPGPWKKVAEYKLVPASAGDLGVVGYCNPSDPVGAAQQTWEEVKGDFGAYAGKSVWVRLNLKYGGENRTASQACSWYVDDIKISTTGTPGNTGAAAPAVTSPSAPAPAVRPTVKLGAFKAKGKKATLKLTVAGGSVKSVTVTLLKGKKKIAVAKAAELAVGARSVTFKLKSKLKKGSYVLKFSGKAADGSAVTASGKAKAR